MGSYQNPKMWLHWMMRFLWVVRMDGSSVWTDHPALFRIGFILKAPDLSASLSDSTASSLFAIPTWYSYVCMYICLSIRICGFFLTPATYCIERWTCVHAYGWWMDVCVHTYIYVCMCVYIYMYVCMYVCMYICMYVWIYGCIMDLGFAQCYWRQVWGVDRWGWWSEIQVRFPILLALYYMNA